MVRCKFKCYEITEFVGWTWNEEKKISVPCKALKFKFQVTPGGSKENDHFYAVSGGSNLDLCTVNPLVFDKFKVGGEYYSDFTEAIVEPIPVAA